MELMQLEMFVAMVEEGTFHKAAERVFRTQPALSMALRKLEQEIGSPLFDRSNRGAYVLTDTGEVLYDYAKRLLNLRDEASVAIGGLHSVQTGRLRIGANESTCIYLLPELINRFRASYPGVRIEILKHASSRLPHELRQRNLDFAIMSFPPDERELEARPVMRDELVFVVSDGHRLTGRERVHVRDLGGESFIGHNVRSPSREKLIEAFRRFQTPLNIPIEVESIETIKRMVKMGLGAAFVPLMCVREEVRRGEMAVIPVEGFRYERTLWMIRRKTDAHSHAAESFRRVIESNYEGGLGPRSDSAVGTDEARAEAVN